MTYLANGQSNQLEASLVHLLLRRAIKEANNIRRYDANVCCAFGSLVLFGPVDDVTNYKDTRV